MCVHRIVYVVPPKCDGAFQKQPLSSLSHQARDPRPSPKGR